MDLSELEYCKDCSVVPMIDIDRTSARDTYQIHCIFCGTCVESDDLDNAMEEWNTVNAPNSP